MNDDELDALLKADHIDDAGFTAQVITHLPAPRRKAPRFAILLGATGLGIGAAFVASAPKGLLALLDGAAHSTTWVVPAIVLASVVVVLTGAALTEATSRA